MGEDPFCSACGAIQPPRAGTDHFALLGASRAFAIDLGTLERRYKDLARQVHPDRFAKADPQARRASMAQTVALNEAWKTLRDPVRRAEYLLELAGIDVGSEEGTRRRTAAGASHRVPVPQELLMEIMELREALEDARSEGDEARIAALTAEVRARRHKGMTTVAAALGRKPSSNEHAAEALVAVRYYDRFLSEVNAHAEAAEERLHGG